MEFRLAFDPPAFEKKIAIHDKIIMVGSCFTEHMYGYFSKYKFRCVENPHGTLFNPISIFKSIHHYIDQTSIDEQSLFNQNELWSHWDFHSKLSGTLYSEIKGNVIVKTDHEYPKIKEQSYYLTDGNYPVFIIIKLKVSNIKFLPLECKDDGLTYDIDKIEINNIAKVSLGSGYFMYQIDAIKK